MKRAFYITIAIIGFCTLAANAQSSATPTLSNGAHGTVVKPPVTGANKPQMAATSKATPANPNPPAAKQEPVLAPYATSTTGSKPKK